MSENLEHACAGCVEVFVDAIGDVLWFHHHDLHLLQVLQSPFDGHLRCQAPVFGADEVAYQSYSLQQGQAQHLGQQLVRQ
jgi:hypothetical protein